METEYPTLRRPKRKLCYITDNESPPKHWEGTLTLEDVDRIFDDLGSASHVNLQPPSPLLQTSDSDINQNETEGSPIVLQESQLIEKLQEYQTGPDGDVLHPASSKLDTDLDIPFKGHGPVKTSSPIEQNMAVEGGEEQDNNEEEEKQDIEDDEEEKQNSKHEEEEQDNKEKEEEQDNKEKEEEQDNKEKEEEQDNKEKEEEQDNKEEEEEEEQDNKEEEEEQDNEKEQVVSPILFVCEDEGLEEVKKDDLPTQNPQCNGHISEENDGSALESPPSKIALTKMSAHKEKNEQSNQESPQQPVLTVNQEPEVAAPEVSTRVGKDMTAFLQKLKDAGQSKRSSSVESAQPPVQTVSQECEIAVPEVSTGVGKDMTAFLQKLKDAGQSKLSCFLSSRKSPVKVRTPPPEPEDDFMILEDDTPLCFSIPSKSATSKKQRHRRTSSTDKNNSEDKRTKDRPLEMPDQQQESEKANDKLESHAVDQKIKKTEKEKNSEMTGPRNDDDKQPSPQDTPAGDLLEQEEPTKKKQLKKASSKERDEAEGRPGDRASRKIEKEKPKKTETKASKSGETKKPKSSKVVKENAKTHRANSLKTTTKGLQEADTVNDVDEQSGNKCGDTEDLGSTVGKETMNCEADEQAKQNNHPVVSEGSSSEDCQVLGKRKRKLAGEWWLSCPRSTEETDNNQQPTQKKSKRKPKEQSAAVCSPAKAKKEKISKKTNQKQLEVLPDQQTSEAEKRKSKRSKKGNKRGDTLDKVKATNEEFIMAVPEQTDKQEQQEVPDQDLDQEESNPLIFSQGDHSLNSGNRIFQRVYHHNSNEKLSVAPKTPVSERQSKEQLTEADSAKRRRRAPGSWWVVNNMAADLENRSSQPQQLHSKGSKPNKEMKKTSKQSKSPRLGVPKNGNAAVLVKPLGGAPVPPLKPKSLLTPKTVKRSLATFKDIFTLVTESPTAVSSRDRRQTNRCNVTPRPAEELCVPYSNTDTAHNSPDTHEAPQDSSRSQVLRSGPSSMIELEDYEDNDSIVLPSTRSPGLLPAAEFCAPPLKSLILQRKDKANLTEWFKSLWPTTSDNGPGVTPDQFDWYFYQDRAMGLQVDLSSDSFCSGKLLLGSLMKKPLWVDHSATTVFNLITSSVCVTIDGCESRFSPGQSFVVEYGHAYAIQNVTSQPAVLYFTRMLAGTIN